MGHRWWNKNDNAGTKASWEEFVDEGGITHQAQFFGLPMIIGAKAAYTDDRKIISVDIAVPQLVGPKTLRETLDGLYRSNTKETGNFRAPVSRWALWRRRVLHLL